MKRVLRVVLYLAVLVAVFWYAVINLSEINRYDFHLSGGPFIRAVLLQIAAYGVFFLAWLSLSSKCGAQTTLGRAARGWFSSHLAKYIPGKVPTMLVRMDHYPKGKRTGMAIAWIGEGFLVLLGSAAVVGIVGLLKPDALFAEMKIVAIIVCLIVALTGIPSIQAIVMQRIPAIGPSAGQKIKGWFSILTVTGYISGAFVQSLCFISVVQALHDVSTPQWAPIIIAFHAARFAGIIAFFSPGGIGVQEGVMFVLLESVVPKPVAIVATLLYRLLTLGTETLLSILAFLLVEEKGPDLHHDEELPPIP